MSDNLENVKVGDILLITSGMFGNSLDKVKKVNKTTIITDSNRKFNKRGYSVPRTAWSRVSARLASSNDIDNVILKKSVNNVLEKAQKLYATVINNNMILDNAEEYNQRLKTIKIILNNVLDDITKKDKK